MKLPFSITPDIRASLTDQLVGGIRAAVQAGRYRPGDRLPGTRALAKALGISVRAPTEAFRRLADEGVLEVRTKSGAVVRERGTRVWKGHVLVVLPDGEFNYFQNVFAGRFANKLAKGGYLTSLVTTPRGHGGRHDISTLEVALSGAVDFVFCVRHERDVVAAISSRGVPFAVVSEDVIRRPPRGCVAVVPHDMSKAVAELVAHCRRAGVRNVLVVCKSIANDQFSRDFAGSGVRAERMVVTPKTSGGRECRIVNIQRAVVERFERLFAERGREWLPDLFFFTDDHAATSAIITLLSHGVRIPQDVKIASVSNKGLGPAMPMSLTSIELSAVSVAYDMADATLKFLSSGKFPSGLRIERQYIIGGTFAYDAAAGRQGDQAPPAGYAEGGVDHRRRTGTERVGLAEPWMPPAALYGPRPGRRHGRRRRGVQFLTGSKQGKRKSHETKQKRVSRTGRNGRSGGVAGWARAGCGKTGGA